MVRRTVVIVALLGGVALATARPSVAQQSGFSVPTGPRTSWRGRIHIRNGPFASVYREHWGNGITDNGLALGNTIVGGLVTVLPPVLDRIIGQGVQQGIEYDPAGDACTPAEVPSNDANFSSRTVALTNLKKNQMELLASLGIKDDQYRELLTPPAPDQDVIEWDGGPAAQRAGQANPQKQQSFQNQQLSQKQQSGQQQQLHQGIQSPQYPQVFWLYQVPQCDQPTQPQQAAPQQTAPQQAAPQQAAPQQAAPQQAAPQQTHGQQAVPQPQPRQLPPPQPEPAPEP